VETICFPKASLCKRSPQRSVRRGTGRAGAVSLARQRTDKTAIPHFKQIWKEKPPEIAELGAKLENYICADNLISGNPNKSY
jgi:hypothetical protein